MEPMTRARRLPTQFDDEANRDVAPSTPTCCCCCCCLVTALTSSSLTAAHLGELADENGKNTEARTTLRVAGAVSLAAAASASVLVHFVVRDLHPVVHLVIAAAVWLVLLAALYSQAGTGPERALGWAASIVVTTLAAGAAELVLGFFLIFIGPLYALLVVSVPVFVTKRFLRWSRDRS